MNEADQAIVFFSLEAIKHKGLEPIKEEEIKSAFNNKELIVLSDDIKLKTHLKNLNLENTNLLLMSSGNFNKMNLNEI